MGLAPKAGWVTLGGRLGVLWAGSARPPPPKRSPSAAQVRPKGPCTAPCQKSVAVFLTEKIRSH